MIYLLGGEGFVGSALARSCRRRGLEHAVITRQNYAGFVGRPCRLLINANGNSKKYRARERPLDEFDDSVRTVRASLIDFPADRYVYLSSCDVYADCSSPLTTQEEQPPAVERQSPYGFHKYLAEQCVRHAARRWLILRLGGLVGPGLRKNAIFDILQGGPLWLDPDSQLQFLHTDALADVLFTLLERGVERQVVNVCGRGVVQLREVIGWVGRPVKVKPGSPRVRYDVYVACLESWTAIPDSRRTVFDFVTTCTRGRSARAREGFADDHLANAVAD